MTPSFRTPRGERLLFLSNDIFVCPAYIRELVLDAPARGAGYGIFRGCSNYVDGNSPLHNVATGAFSAREDFCVFGAEFAHRRRGRGLLDDRYLVGDAFLVTRPVIDSIGTFDPRFFGYCGDLDFGLRAQIAGFRIALVQSAFALHEKHGNIDYLPEQEQADKMARRHARVARALNVLMRKYGILIEEVSVNTLPWEELARASFEPARHYAPPNDYSAHLVPA